MRQRQWRTILPLVQLAAYLPLVWYGCWYRPTWQHWFQSWMSPSSESSGFYPNFIDGIESFPEQLAAGINLPAVVIAGLSVMQFDGWLHSGASSELAVHLVTAIYIPLLWYFIGKRLDEGRKMKSPLSKRGKAVAVITLAGLLSIAVLVLWSFLEGQRYMMVGLSLAWVGCGIFGVVFRLREKRRNVSPQFI